MILKYVMINGVHPVLFFNGIQHKDLARLGEITSAGFVSLIDGADPETLGESLSLNMQPANSDAVMIKNCIQLTGGHGL